MKKLLSYMLICCTATFAASHVYVVHGYGSSRLAMRKMCSMLRDSGLTVHNWGYSSLTRAIPDVSADLFAEIKTHGPKDTVHFVTHSMGGLIVRALLSSAARDSAAPLIHRIVMVAPPNRGAQLAQFFADWDIVKWIMGPNVSMMSTDTGSFANRLPVPRDEELGTIAGARFDDRGYNPFIDGDNDGFMTVDRTQLGVEDDFIVLPRGHILMIRDRAVLANVLEFLRTGRFLHGPEAGPGDG